ncbi:MAG: sugar phosphate isomerase/epimerase [Candidatus Kuenenia sp.]|nr:sugar phosphate isomerase/epimerase [Candidatus Kuenenia hertensis]
MSVLIEMSTMCFLNANVLTKIKNCKEIIESQGFEFGIQLHNSTSKELYNKLKGHDVKYTVHAPLFSQYFINLAGDNFGSIVRNFKSTANFMEKMNSNIAILHGFFMTKKPIKNDPANYGKVLRDAIDSKYLLHNTRVMDPKYLETEEFRNYQKRVKTNMERLRNHFPKYILCMENDFPGLGNGNQTLEHLKYLDCPIWIDTGHLWASAILNNFDFYKDLDAICKQCNVMGVHLNTNQTPLNWNFKVPLGDTHSHFSTDYDMDMSKIISILKENQITHFTIEIIDGNEKDVNFLIEMYQGL